jgi:O-antigen ligase
VLPVGLSVLLLVFLIPLQNIYLGKLPTLGGGMNSLNLLVLLALLSSFRNALTPLKSPTTVGRLLVALMVVYLLSIVVVQVRIGYIPEESFSAIKDIFVGIIFYYIVVNSVYTQKALLWVIGATIAPLPYMFYVFLDQWLSVQRWHYTDDMRLVPGTFMELGSNEIAAFFATYSMVLIAGIIWLKEFKYRLALVPFLLMNAFCVLYSYSRGAYLSFIAGCFVLLALRSRKLGIVTVIGVLLFSSVLTGYLPVSVQERVDSMFVEEQDRDESAQSRFDLWGLAIDEFSKSPIFGIGFRAFREVGPTGQDTHNYFVKVLAEQGIIGLLVIVGLLISIIARSLHLFRTAKDPTNRALGGGMVACTAALIIGNVFGDRFTHYPLIAYFWVYAGLVHIGIAIEEQSDKTAEGSSGR